MRTTKTCAYIFGYTLVLSYCTSMYFLLNIHVRFSTFLILCKIRNTETHNKWFIEGSIYHEPHSFLMLLPLDIEDILFLSTAWAVQSKFIISQSFSSLSMYRIFNYFFIYIVSHIQRLWNRFPKTELRYFM